MRLVVDANILVAEAMRLRGQALLSHPRVALAMTERAWAEALYEARQRLRGLVALGRIPDVRAEEVLTLLESTLATTITVVPEAAYADREPSARRRIPRDPDDRPTVALALALDAGIWTLDNDFLGCGVPTWTTETLLAYLEEMVDSTT